MKASVADLSKTALYQELIVVEHTDDRLIAVPSDWFDGELRGVQRYQLDQLGLAQAAIVRGEAVSVTLR